MTEQVHDPLYLSPEQQEVWRVLPYAQKIELSRYTQDFSTGFRWYRQESDYWRVMENYLIEEIDTSVERAIVTMVWRDFDLADQAGFPKLTPQSALLLARTAIRIGSILGTGQDGSRLDGGMAMCGTALTGMHNTILGSRNVITSDEAVASLENTALSIHKCIFES